MFGQLGVVDKRFFMLKHITQLNNYQLEGTVADTKHNNSQYDQVVRMIPSSQVGSIDLS